VLWAAVAVFAAGAYRVIGAGGRRAAGSESGSIFNETPDGASLAFGYLKERANGGRGQAPVVLSQRLGPGRLPSDGVLLRLEPHRVAVAAPDEETEGKGKKGVERLVPLLAPAEAAWVREGGRLVLAVDASYGPLALKEARSAPVRKTFPSFPGVVTLAPATPLRAISGPIADDALALFAAGAARICATLAIGRGEVVLLSAPEILENEKLAQADHLRLLEALLPPERPAAFDEWAHGLGQEAGLLRLLFAWGFGPALATAALAFGLTLWRSRARLGPPEEDVLEARSEAVDLVQSLSQLYDRALSRREAAALDLEGFRRAVALRSGLAGAALEKRVRQLIGTTLPPLRPAGEIPAAELQQRLRTLNDAYRRLHEHAHTRRRA
jgi:hypothetical protein